VILLVTYALFPHPGRRGEARLGRESVFHRRARTRCLGSFQVAGMAYPTYNLILVAVALFFGLGLAWLLHSTRAGKLLLAVIHDPEVSRADGRQRRPLLPRDLRLGLVARRARRAFTAPTGLGRPGLGVE
jgi:branched-chain amino acid transport system permease protein